MLPTLSGSSNPQNDLHQQIIVSLDDKERRQRPAVSSTSMFVETDVVTTTGKGTGVQAQPSRTVFKNTTMVVTLLYNEEQSWKTTMQQEAQSDCTIDHDRKDQALPQPPSVTQNHEECAKDTGNFLLEKEVQNLPVSVFSVDKLLPLPSWKVSNQSTINNTTTTSTAAAAAKTLEKKQQLFQPEIAYSHLLHNRTGPTVFTPLFNGKMGQECNGYLTFIIQNYDNLPDVSVFLHANPTDHNKHILQDISHVLNHWKPEEIGFLHLNDNLYCRRGTPYFHNNNNNNDNMDAEIMIPTSSQRQRQLHRASYQAGDDWLSLWTLLGFQPEALPPFVRMPCCAQFMVTRERIQLRSKWFYQQLLKITYETQKCAFQEHFWHVFFGEHPLLASERQIRHYRVYHHDENDDDDDDDDDDNDDETSASSSVVVAEWKVSPQSARLHNPYPNVPPLTNSMKVWYNAAVLSPSTYYPHITIQDCSCIGTEECSE